MAAVGRLPAHAGRNRWRMACAAPDWLTALAVWRACLRRDALLGDYPPRRHVRWLGSQRSGPDLDFSAVDTGFLSRAAAAGAPLAVRSLALSLLLGVGVTEHR